MDVNAFSCQFFSSQARKDKSIISITNLVSFDDVLREIMKVALFSVFLVCLGSLAAGESINSISTHTNSCLFCGMVEGVGYLTAKVRGSKSRRMMANTRDSINASGLRQYRLLSVKKPR